MEYKHFDYCLLRLAEPIEREKYLSLSLNEAAPPTQLTLIGMGRGDNKGKLRRAAIGECRVSRESQLLGYRLNEELGVGMGAPLLSADCEVVATHQLIQYNHDRSKYFRGARLLSAEVAEKVLEWAEELGAAPPRVVVRHNGTVTAVTSLADLKKALEGPEKEIIAATLASVNWNRQKAAKLLDINRTTLFNKMRKYELLEIKRGGVRREGA